MLRLPELEIGLARRDQDNFLVELRFTDPQAQGLRAPQRGVFHVPVDQLRQHILDSKAYGTVLFRALFADPSLLKLYDLARSLAQNNGVPLRVRLYIHPDAAGLHNLRWETLYDERPGGGWLLTGEDLRFSRFLSSTIVKRVELRARAELCALVVIANPHNLQSGDYVIGGEPLAEVDVGFEITRAQEGLGPLFSDDHLLASAPDAPGRVTLEKLHQRLREGFDIVYLACHGVFRKRGRHAGPHILLEKPDGSAEFVHGDELARCIQDLAPELRPRLMVLASCQSAGKGDRSDLLESGEEAEEMVTPLGPRLNQAGVPAVIAMQGNIGMTTARDFVANFFQELLSDDSGQIDRAVAVARSAVQRQPDSWMPVLYTLLQYGSLWYQPGFARVGPEFNRWPALVTSLKVSKCTPILGADLCASIIGTPSSIATQWAEETRYPLSEEGRDQLPQVAQYLANLHNQPVQPRLKLAEMIEMRLKKRFGLEEMPARQEWLQPTLLNEVGRQLIDTEGDGGELPESFRATYATLARLPVQIYISTTPDILLEAALTAIGKEPVVDYLRWWGSDLEIRPFNLPPGTEPYQPDIQHPLVFHLFGVMNEPASMVVSEDDYFDYLMWINQSGAQIPPMVPRVWSVNALLFLGFNLNDWQFRVLFRSLPIYERLGRRDAQPSLAVQVRPDVTNIDPEGTRSYLEQYFLGVKMGMYWGSAEEFCQQLDQICSAENIYDRTS